MTSYLRAVLGACLLLIAESAAAEAQRLLDWPTRTSAGAAALARGAAAAFWNPAGAARLDGRADAMVLDIRGPAETTINGLAVAGAVELDGRTTVFAGYRHLGMDEIVRTSTSPLQDEAEPWIDVSGDLLVLGGSRELTPALRAGAVLHLSRETLGPVRESGAAAGAGLVYRPGMTLEPALAVAVFTSPADPRWIAGIEVGRRAQADRPWSGGLSYGLSGESVQRGVAHRVAANSHWTDRFSLSAGVDVEPGGDGAAWLPVVAGSARFSRYTLGVVREQSAGGFGASYYYRLHVRL